MAAAAAAVTSSQPSVWRWGINSRTHMDIWTRRLKYNVRDDSYTHLRLNGGKLCIPDHAIKDFYDILAQDVAQGGQPNFVVEMRRPPPFPSRCVIDFDAECEA